MKTLTLILFLYCPFSVFADEGFTVVLPDFYEGNPIIYTNSDEWKALLAENEEFRRIVSESDTELQKYKKQIDSYLEQQDQIRNEMILEITKLRIEAGEKDALLWKRLFIIIGMGIGIVGYIAAKIYLPFIP